MDSRSIFSTSRADLLSKDPMPMLMGMENWKSACEKAARLSIDLGINARDLLAASQAESVDEALTVLSTLVVMLDGARRVLFAVHPALSGRLLNRVESARIAAVQAFEATAAEGCPSMAESCPVEPAVSP